MNKDGDSILKDEGDFFNANQNAYESALNSDNLLNSAQIAKVKRLEFLPKRKEYLHKG